ncbi:MAG: hypothetical protein QOD90_6193 [Mycobacterium sp.]|jgi:hypothetical protein|nr:hypothetical protein [Mycobacterium sp.]
MISLKTIVGGATIAGSLALGIFSGVANAAPPPVEPQVPVVQGGDRTPGPSTPSPYAAYGDRSVCATPGLYFVNICV